MPIYVFKNKETGEAAEYFIKMADKAQFKEDNPELEEIIRMPCAGNRGWRY